MLYLSERDLQSQRLIYLLKEENQIHFILRENKRVKSKKE